MKRDETTDVTNRGAARELLHLLLSQVVPAAANPRLTMEKESFQELSKSIEQNGVLQPIVVRPLGDKYEIIGGHRRHAVLVELAAKHPGDPRFTHIPAAVIEADDAQAPVLRLVENINRSDLTPLEQVEGLARAVEAGNKKEVLAAGLGWPMRKLYKYLQLAEAPAWLRDHLQWKAKSSSR
ncbi:MAG TPA: ParB/RepB/Spo0J family partition protein [Gammaproteobacteria bacterium]|nr:ParB/RepB/Spo0J family partition protein [Gammaproteobacteria bacterium]